MLSDIEIAQSCQMRPIAEVAAAAGLDADDLELYGKYKAKLSTDVWTKLEGHENGKLVLVTAINPTPAGEGKTTTTVGLGQAMAQAWQECGDRAARAVPRPCIRHQGRRGRRRLCAGCADGGHQPAFYWRYARYHRREQPSLRHAGQPHAAGQRARTSTRVA